MGHSMIQQERSKAGLTEMVISGQCLMDTAIVHDNEGEAIGHTPFLVSSSFVKLKCALIERIGEWKEHDAGIGVERGEQLNRGLAITLPREGITDFEKDRVGRDEASTLGFNESGDLDGPAMVSIRARRKSDRKRGVESTSRMDPRDSRNEPSSETIEEKQNTPRASRS